MTKTEAKKLRKKHISTAALTLATIAFLGAIANILYVWWRDSKEWEEAKRNGHNGNDR